ncbi:2-dehydropantoate 2-reductase [Bosea sp. (in: a-proteobacteria)]|uniref:ketopantoate reductase family protein n=1 Tax=Bosea sp. (in: a-proteobacteria) TaxID=1871050 RepID=UPI0031FF0DC6
MSPIRISILGAGAMGSLFGGLLAEAGHAVELIDVNPAQIAAVRERGLLIRNDAGERRLKLPILRPQEATTQPDWLIVFTKAMHTQGALESARHLIGPQTRLLSLQNGLGNAEKLMAFADASRIAIGMTTVPADLVAPGEVHSHGESKTRVVMVDGSTAAALDKLASALDAAGLPCAVDPDAIVAIWEKVAFNVALNSLCAVTQRTVGGLGSASEGRRLAHAVASEVLAVAQAEGLAVLAQRTHATIDHALDHHGGHKPSMLQDLLAKRPTEIETLNGAVVRIAENHAIAAPRTEALYALVKMAEQSA